MSESTHSTTGRRLYRDRDKGVILGVCAGISDYFGFDLAITRIVTALSLLFFTLPTTIAYFVLALLLPKRPRALGRPMDADADSLQRQVRSAPHATLDSVRHRFREMDARLQRMEKYLTSSRFELDRQFKDLGGQ
jgi:phage shock protein C